MGIFEDIPLRSNGDTDDVEASWWNVIRAALVDAFPSYGVPSGGSAFTIVTNQTSYADITGLVFDYTEFRAFKVRYYIYREDDTPDKRTEMGMLTGYYHDGAWVFTRDIETGNALGDGVEGGDYGTDYLTITSGGQVQYKSSNMAGGSYVGEFDFKVTEVWSA